LTILMLHSLIAILFARLGMSVEEASEEFGTIMERVYKPDGLSPSESTGRLRGFMEDIMKRKGLPLNFPLTEKRQLGGCAG
jgi:hypothetical protein